MGRLDNEREIAHWMIDRYGAEAPERAHRYSEGNQALGSEDVAEMWENVAG